MSIFIWSYESVETLQQKWQRRDPSEPEQIVRVCTGKVRVWHGFSTRFKNIVFWKNTMYLCQKFGLARVKYGFGTGSARVQNKPELFSVGCLKIQSSPILAIRWDRYFGAYNHDHASSSFSQDLDKKKRQTMIISCDYDMTMTMIGWFVMICVRGLLKWCQIMWKQRLFSHPGKTRCFSWKHDVFAVHPGKHEVYMFILQKVRLSLY